MIKLKKILLLFFAAFVAIIVFSSYCTAQNTVINGDTIEIRLNGEKSGEVQWQFSDGDVTWKNISGANNSVLNHRITKSENIRAKVSTGKCSFYSDTTSFEAFDFNYRDEKGLSRISKTSEFIILIPDIQNYISEVTNKKYLENIIDWIVKFNNSGFKVKAVLQTGDVTNYNSIPEWERAQKIFSKLDNKIDYIFCTGNHDYGDNGICNNRNTLFNKYFNYKSNASFISSFEKDNYENTYFNINIHNQPFQIFSLEFGPRDKVISWADSIVKVNSETTGIVLTHAYLSKHGRFDFVKYKYDQYASPYAYAITYPLFSAEKINDGEEVWKKLVFKNTNIKFVFCGHNIKPDNDFNLISQNSKNDNVFQMVYNKQDSPFGGEGWIKIIEFSKNKIVSFKAYSTLLKKWDENALYLNTFQF